MARRGGSGVSAARSAGMPPLAHRRTSPSGSRRSGGRSRRRSGIAGWSRAHERRLAARPMTCTSPQCAQLAPVSTVMSAPNTDASWPAEAFPSSMSSGLASGPQDRRSSAGSSVGYVPVGPKRSVRTRSGGRPRRTSPFGHGLDQRRRAAQVRPSGRPRVARAPPPACARRSVARSPTSPAAGTGSACGRPPARRPSDASRSSSSR